MKDCPAQVPRDKGKFVLIYNREHRHMKHVRGWTKRRTNHFIISALTVAKMEQVKRQKSGNPVGLDNL